MREYIRLAQKFTADVSYEQFRADSMINLATIRCLEIVSEASRHIDADCKARPPRIAWRDVADAGNIYRHAYGSIRLDLIWGTVHEMLPPLLQAVESELVTSPR